MVEREEKKAIEGADILFLLTTKYEIKMNKNITGVRKDDAVFYGTDVLYNFINSILRNMDKAQQFNQAVITIHSHSLSSVLLD